MSTSSRGTAAALFGVLGVLAIPAGVIAAQELSGLSLIHSLYWSVPSAAVLALLGLLLLRRTRLRLGRSVFAETRKVARTTQVLVWTAVWLAVTGGVALGFYGVLRWAP